MSRLKKIDELLLFFLLSISLLLVSSYAGIINLFPENPETYKETFDFNHNSAYTYDSDSLISGIQVLNPDLKIYYSLDGGDSYSCGGRYLSLDGLTNPLIVQYQTAWRTNAPDFNLPEVKSLQLFLVNEDQKSRSQKNNLTYTGDFKTELPIISLNISQDEFIGELNGIYSLGMSSWKNEEFNIAWWLREGNYTQRGAEWEKKINFTFIENGKEKFNQNCGIKISGNATRGFPQKSFKIYARKMYGEETMKFPFFGETGLGDYESLVLRTSGNDNTRTLFADLMIHRIADGSKVFVQKGISTQVFINGNYWGIYNLRERISQENLAEYYDCKSDEVTILENSYAELKDGSIEEHVAFHSLVERILSEEILSDEFIESINKELSLKSFMDYIFFETFFANRDWPHNNSTCFKIEDKKWKWALNDLDYALAYSGEDNVTTNMFLEIESSPAIFAKLFIKLLENENFKNDFIDRSESNIEKYIDDKAVDFYTEAKSSLDSDIPYHIKRWRSISSIDQWNFDCERNLSFLKERGEIYKKQLKSL